MTDDAANRLQAGRAASARHAWQEAFALLSAADAASPMAPEDLDLLAEAAWWIGRITECIAARERAYASYMEAGKPARAALTAVELARAYFQKGDGSVGLAWVNRADRLLEGEPESVAHGYVARVRGVVHFEGERNLEGALTHAGRALDLATRFHDRDLMAIALHDQGRIFVAKGEVARGNALMDEATLAAVSGELGPMATATIYCNTITACKDLADYPRAREWTEAAKRWCERQAIAGFPGMCRVYRASIMRLRGAWAEAEGEARRACEELREFNVGYCAAGLYEIGEIRLRMGDLSAAEEAFRQAHELGRIPEPGLSVLRMTEGKVKTALASIRRALADESDRLHRAHLLPALVEIGLAAGEREGLRAAVEELEEIARAFGTPALDAGAAAARGLLLLAEGDAAGAARHLRRAWSLWQEIDCPYEAARTQMPLAEAYAAEGDPDAAALELQAARAAFDRLGARLDERRAAGQLSASESAARPGGADRRDVRTFMFTDIVRSTSLLEAIGDDAWTDLARWHDETLRAEFARHGGEEIDHAGDGFFVAFEDTAAAVACAAAIQRALAEHRRAHGFAPQVRIGLHAAAATRQGTAYRGRGVHEAARIASVAEGGEIVASEETLAGTPGVETSAPRRVELKGLTEPITLVTVVWR